jgi:hypothetical protein
MIAQLNHQQLPCFVCKRFSSQLAARSDMPVDSMQQAKTVLIFVAAAQGAEIKGQVGSFVLVFWLCLSYYLGSCSIAVAGG